MQNVYSIATPPAYFTKLLNAPSEAYKPCYQARPGMQLPVLLHTPQGGRAVCATWGLFLPGRPDPITQVHMRDVLRQRPYSSLVRTQRCAVPTNCFIIRKGTEVRLVRLLQHRVSCMGGIFQRTTHRGSVSLRFALLQMAPADILLQHCDHMPVCFSIDQWKEWVGNEELGDIMQMADRTHKQWFDHFKISEKILNVDMEDRDLLRPLGASFRQLRDRKAALDNIDVDMLRASSGSKH